MDCTVCVRVHQVAPVFRKGKPNFQLQVYNQLCELHPVQIFDHSKMIVAKEDLASGRVLSESDFDYRSPGHGIAPADSGILVGKALTRDIAALSPILEGDVA